MTGRSCAEQPAARAGRASASRQSAGKNHNTQMRAAQAWTERGTTISLRLGICGTQGEGPLRSYLPRISIVNGRSGRAQLRSSAPAEPLQSYEFDALWEGEAPAEPLQSYEFDALWEGEAPADPLQSYEFDVDWEFEARAEPLQSYEFDVDWEGEAPAEPLFKRTPSARPTAWPSFAHQIT